MNGSEQAISAMSSVASAETMRSVGHNPSADEDARRWLWFEADEGIRSRLRVLREIDGAILGGANDA